MKRSPAHAASSRDARHAGADWDRGLFLCVLAVTLLCLALGGYAMLASAIGQRVFAEVRSCSTELHVSGHFWRHQTRCAVTVAAQGTHEIDTSAGYRPGTRVQVLVLGGQVTDVRLARAEMWFLAPVPLSVAVLARKGWPRKG